MVQLNYKFLDVPILIKNGVTETDFSVKSTDSR